MAEEGGSKKKVMVAIDESEYSHYALEWALTKLRDSISTSSLIIFTAEPRSEINYISAAAYGAAPPELIMSVQNYKDKLAVALLEKAKEICAAHGVTAETIAQIGDPKEVICEAVEKLNIDLLIVGSHGRGFIQRAFLGSVSSYCGNHAKCPVLIVKKPE
ncbi:universal stress protein A-like protein [Macadamia integrifolia]|uniref:universal stress protein A-like protein n=1 Tax=Macadamia integrifolia TaxID=60698 RepID=UPI001C500445|nr:universal stress protein A-like protein [Macadamia integrifolia]